MAVAVPIPPSSTESTGSTSLPVEEFERLDVAEKDAAYKTLYRRKDGLKAEVWVTRLADGAVDRELTIRIENLENDNTRIQAENTRILAENARLFAENARLFAENAKLKREVHVLQETNVKYRTALTALLTKLEMNPDEYI